MARTNFDIIRGLMIADNTLDSWICETEAEEKRELYEGICSWFDGFSKNCFN